MIFSFPPFFSHSVPVTPNFSDGASAAIIMQERAARLVFRFIVIGDDALSTYVSYWFDLVVCYEGRWV